MYSLSNFKRPINDTGLGIHLWPNPYGNNVAFWLDRVVAMKMKWVTTLNTDAGFMQEAAVRGLGVVCRPFYRANRAWGDDGSCVENMLAAGLPPYIQIYNEPELLGTEWENEVPGSEEWAKTTWANRWLQAAQTIYTRGGYPGIQCLDLDWYAYLLERIKNELPVVLDRLWFCCHNYMSNHPPDYMQDEFGWLAPLWFDKVANEVLGHSLMTICGEGGWCVGDAADNRYPVITEELHTRYTVESFDVFRTEMLPTVPPRFLPPWWYAVTPWLLVSVQVGGDSAFEQNAWYSDWHQNRAAIEAVKAMPVFVRQMQGGAIPEPQPEPAPKEEPTMPNQLTAAPEQWFNSPNYTPGRTQPLDLIIIHSTRGGAPIGQEAQGTVTWVMMPSSEDSAHALITQDARLIHFVADGDSAWGAGKDNNARSLQVELEQPDNDTPFSAAQMAKLAEVLLWWGSQHDIPLDPVHVQGHDQTPQGIQQGKSDPGKMFDWPNLWAMVGYTSERERLANEILADLDNIKAKVIRLI